MNLQPAALRLRHILTLTYLADLAIFSEQETEKASVAKELS
jgi:hypothetical protein